MQQVLTVNFDIITKWIQTYLFHLMDNLPIQYFPAHQFRSTQYLTGIKGVIMLKDLSIAATSIANFIA